ncbi:hypothetical protein L3Q82_007051 [Scortum barcoo]|uniref:Uncharacterized protein n=1 Tax=Scortum barcoo TaxID=214431 RepID=A0ACB8WXJ9_9TELE|nr:hypothetical protein L3Q82_007051 [Scortum barcoo]
MLWSCRFSQSGTGIRTGSAAGSGLRSGGEVQSCRPEVRVALIRRTSDHRVKLTGSERDQSSTDPGSTENHVHQWRPTRVGQTRTTESPSKVSETKSLGLCLIRVLNRPLINLSALIQPRSRSRPGPLRTAGMVSDQISETRTRRMFEKVQGPESCRGEGGPPGIMSRSRSEGDRTEIRTGTRTRRRRKIHPSEFRGRVHKARGLMGKSPWSCDSYVKLSVTSDLNWRIRMKTPTVLNNKNPEYNQRFTLCVSDDLVLSRLLVSVFSRRSRLIGCMSFGIGSLLASSKLQSSDKSLTVRQNQLSDPVLSGLRTVRMFWKNAAWSWDSAGNDDDNDDGGYLLAADLRRTPDSAPDTDMNRITTATSAATTTTNLSNCSTTTGLKHRTDHILTSGHPHSLDPTNANHSSGPANDNYSRYISTLYGNINQLQATTDNSSQQLTERMNRNRLKKEGPPCLADATPPKPPIWPAEVEEMNMVVFGGTLGQDGPNALIRGFCLHDELMLGFRHGQNRSVLFEEKMVLDSRSVLTVQSEFRLSTRCSAQSAFIGRLSAGGPAHQSGLRQGDSVLQLNGLPVETWKCVDLAHAIRSCPSQIVLVVWRGLPELRSGCESLLRPPTHNTLTSRKLLPHPAHSKHGHRRGQGLGIRSSLGALGSLWRDRKEDREEEEEEEEHDVTEYSPCTTTLKSTHVTSSQGDNYIILSPVSPGGQLLQPVYRDGNGMIGRLYQTHPSRGQNLLHDPRPGSTQRPLTSRTTTLSPSSISSSSSSALPRNYGNYQNCTIVQSHLPCSTYGTYVSLTPKTLIFPIFVQPLDLCSPDRTLLMSEEMILHQADLLPSKVTVLIYSDLLLFTREDEARRCHVLQSPVYLNTLQLREEEAEEEGEVPVQMCGGERPVLLHHRVARQLLGGREEGSAEGGEGCTEDCGMQSTHHHGHLHLQMQETGLLYHEGPHSHRTRKLFVPLPSGRRLQSIKSRTTRLRNSFFPGSSPSEPLLLYFLQDSVNLFSLESFSIEQKVRVSLCLHDNIQLQLVTMDTGHTHQLSDLPSDFGLLSLQQSDLLYRPSSLYSSFDPPLLHPSSPLRPSFPSSYSPSSPFSSTTPSRPLSSLSPYTFSSSSSPPSRIFTSSSPPSSFTQKSPIWKERAEEQEEERRERRREEQEVEERQQGEGESASETSENVGGVGGRGLMLSPYTFNMKEEKSDEEEEDGGGAEEFISTYRPAVLRRSLSEGSLLQVPRSPRFLSDSTIHRLTHPTTFDLDLDPSTGSAPQRPSIHTLRKQLTREGGSLHNMLLLLSGTKVETGQTIREQYRSKKQGKTSREQVRPEETKTDQWIAIQTSREQGRSVETRRDQQGAIQTTRDKDRQTVMTNSLRL